MGNMMCPGGEHALCFGERQGKTKQNECKTRNQERQMKTNETQKENAHPVYKAFIETNVSKTFSREEVRNTVLAGYMGLIKQIDDNLGRLFKFIEVSGNMKDTMIVFTSDHGDYHGDHWLGEKEFFH